MLDGAIVWALDTSMGPPGPGGNWPLWLALLFFGSNLVKGLCLCAIPLIVAAKWRNHREGVSAWQFARVFGFLPFIGFSALIRVAEIGGPPYHLTAAVDTVSAAALLACCRYQTGLMDHIGKLPSRQQLHDARNDAQVKAAQLEIARLELVAWRKTMTGMVERVKDSAHYASRLEHLADIEAVADELRRGP